MKIIHADAAEGCKQLADGSVDLVMTSPPYANRRKGLYDGIDEADYPAWFASIAREFYRVLADDGSMVVNIKEHVVDNERSLYVYETIKALRDAGWMWRDDFIWAKTQPFPNHGLYRLKDGWEHCLHFSKGKVIKFNKHDITVERKPRQHRSTADVRVNTSSAGNQYAINRSKTENIERAIPSNVIHAGVSAKSGHPATYPPAIPEFFIKLMTDAGDTVLDPFAGSGTTGLVADGLGRKAICIDNKADYIQLMQNAKPWFPKPDKGNANAASVPSTAHNEPPASQLLTPEENA